MVGLVGLVNAQGLPPLPKAASPSGAKNTVPATPPPTPLPDSPLLPVSPKDVPKSARPCSAMPEVADGAGLLFDPHSTEEITRAMADVLLDAELRARMERLGLQRATLFNWQKTAERTLQVYHEVAERNRPARRNVKPAPAVRR